MSDLSFPHQVQLKGYSAYNLGYVLCELLPLGNLRLFYVRPHWTKLGDQNRRGLLKYLKLDLQAEGDVMPGLIDLRPEDIHLETSQATDPPAPLPDEPEPPEPEPPPELQAIIKMHITRAAGLPLVVGDWFEPGAAVELRAPDGRIAGRTQTGAKGGEFGPNSFEAGYTTGDGDWLLDIGEYQFIVPIVAAERFTKLHFEHVTGDVLARLVSVPMLRSRGEAVLVILDADAETTGLFTIEMVNG